MTNPIPAAAIEAGAKARAEGRGTDWENLKHTFPGMAKNIRTETRATLKAAMPELLDTLRGAEIRLDHAKTVTDRLQTRLAAVEKLHKREEIDYCDDPECCDLTPTCAECLVNWPCPTIKAARGE